MDVEVDLENPAVLARLKNNPGMWLWVGEVGFFPFLGALLIFLFHH